MDDEASFIKQAIERSGFPFEMEIASLLSLLKEEGWMGLPSAPYWDEDEGKWLSEGDEIILRENPLSWDSINTYIPQLEARGVTVDY